MDRDREWADSRMDVAAWAARTGAARIERASDRLLREQAKAREAELIRLRARIAQG